MQLDSSPPSLPLVDYLKMEERFENFLISEEGPAGSMLEQLQSEIDNRYAKWWSEANEMSFIDDSGSNTRKDLHHLN